MSISKIAKALNVSKSSVSLVINGKAKQSRISEEMEKKILDYVKEIGFKPNSIAQSLATGKTNTIGLIVENIGDSFFGPIALKIESSLREKGYHVLYSSTNGVDKLGEGIINSMMERRNAALIIAPTMDMNKAIKKLIHSQIPLVIFDRRAQEISTAYVGTNNYEASAVAVKHLFAQGYKNIGMITSDSSQSQMLERKQAYINEVNQQNLKPLLLEIPYRLNVPEREELIGQFINENDLDAIYFSTNYLCISGYKVLSRYDIVHQFGIVSFDDHEVFELVKPTVTCVRQPIIEIAERIVESVLKQINGESDWLRDDIIPSVLVVRNSTQGPNK